MPKKLATVLHTYDEGCGIYICESRAIAWSVAAQIVAENLHEFKETFILSADAPEESEAPSLVAEGVQCAKLLLAGRYAEAVQMYVDRVAGTSENLEVDELPQIEKKLTQLNKQALREFIAEGEAELAERKANGDPTPS